MALRSWLSSRRRILILGGALACVAGVGLVRLSGCGPSNPAREALINGLERLSVPSPDGAVTLSALAAGDDALPRVIYIHGTPGDAKAFVDYLLRPIDGLRAISVDRLGFGQSEPKRAEPSYQKQAEAVALLLEERQGKWPILVGHSLGGPIAARIAADYPGKVGGVVILAGSLSPELERPHWFNNAADWAIVRAVLPRPLRTANDEIMRARPHADALAPLLGRVSAPVAIVHGEEDSLVPVQNVDFMLKAFAGAAEVRVTRIAKRGHFIPWEEPGQVRRAVEWARDHPWHAVKVFDTSPGQAQDQTPGQTPGGSP